MRLTFSIPTAAALACGLLLGLLAESAAAGTYDVSTRRESNQIRAQVAASQFLQRTTFGPTWEEIDELATRVRQVGRRAAFEEWIDAQMALPVSLQRPLVEQMIADDGHSPEEDGVWIQRYRHHAWWHNAIMGEDQLRQRVAFALSQILVVGERGDGFNDRNTGPLGAVRWYGPTNYYDMLLTNAFANYRDTLQDVTLSPVMGVWLTYVRNQKADPSIGRYPDENYAREVMQLFTIGLNKLRQNGSTILYTDGDQAGQPIPTYDNEHIKSFARVFTGLNYGSDPNWWSGRTFEVPMIMDENRHDREEKVLLDGTVLPAGQDGMQDINDALDNLFEHQNIGPFLARRLIQRLVKSNPSKWYIRRVADKFADNGNGVRGDMGAVIKAVLLDGEAITSQRRIRTRELDENGRRREVSLEVIGRGTEYSKLREPTLRYAALLRQFDPVSNYPTGRLMFNSEYSRLNQGPMQSPSVFNFYLPDHKPQGEVIGYQGSSRLPDGELFAPEFQIFTTVAANKMANRFRWDIVDAEASQWVINSNKTGLITNEVALDFSDEIALKDDLPKLLERLDILLCHGTMSDGSKQQIIQAMEDHKITWNDTEYVGTAILLVLTSPDCAVTE